MSEEPTSNKSNLGLVIGLIVIAAIAGYFVRGSMSPKPEVKNDESKMQPTAQVEPQPDKTSADWKISNAMSAAPESVSAEATVLDYPTEEGKDFITLRKGTNEWTCLPDDPSTPGNDPFCGDAQSMKWFSDYMAKKTPQISQPGLAYMLQGGSDASNTDPFAKVPATGESWMKASAHVMIFTTTPPDPKVYGTNPDAGGPWVMWANTPYAHLMMPVK